MDDTLQSLLTELAQFGSQNDVQVQDRQHRMLNITPDTGALLSLLVQATKAQCILELGTSNGYSTLWLADAAWQTGGMVTTVEILEAKAVMARENFARAGLADRIEMHVIDVGDFIRTQSNAAYDFLFLDTDRSQYVAWWADLQRVLTPGGLMVVDNVVSHAAEVEAFVDLISDDTRYSTSLVPIGNGELLVLKQTVFI